MNPYALLHVLLKCLMLLCETVSCVVHALPAEAEEESASASASQVLLFFVFWAGPVLPLATSRDEMVEIVWKLLVIRIDFVQLACTWRDTNYMYCMFKSVALGRALKYSAQSFNTSCSPEDTTDSFYTSDSTFLSPMCSLPYHQDILQKL